jgi:transposase
VAADKEYDSDEIREFLQKNGRIAVIPGRSNRVKPIIYNKHIYKERHLVETFFGYVKEFKRVALRADKTKVSYASFFVLSAILHWIK